MITSESLVASYDVNYLDNLRSLLEHLLNIISKSHSELARREELVRLSELKHYDSSLMRKTYRDPRLFTLDNGTIRPERVYSYSYDEDLNIYENRFIVFLINKLVKDISDSLALFDERFFDSNFKGNIRFGRYGNYQLLRRYETDALYEINKGQDEAASFLKDASSQLSMMKETDFYKRVSPLIASEVHPTNLLVEDRDYQACYKYYLSAVNQEDALLSELLNKLFLERQADSQIQTRTCDLNEMTGYFTFTDNEFSYEVDLDEKRLTITETNSASYIVYQVSAKLALFLPELVFESKEDRIVLPVTLDTTVSELLSALTFILPYKDSCPICHKELTSESGICPTCHANYKVYSREDKKFIWIKNLPNLEIGGDENE